MPIVPRQPPVVIARELFELPGYAAAPKVLPAELRDKIFDHLDRSTLLRLRGVSKAVCADVLAIHRKEFNQKRGNAGAKHSLQAMLQRQHNARNAASCGEITRQIFEVDADLENADKTLFDQTSCEHIVLTRAGRLLAIGPYAQGAVVQLLEAAMLQPPGVLPEARPLSEARQQSAQAVLLAAVTLPNGRGRRVLTHQEIQGLRLWSLADGTAPRWCTLLFQPYQPQDLQGLLQGRVTLSANGNGVLYEADGGAKVWHWRMPSRTSSGSEVFSTYTDFAQERVKVSVTDGLVLRKNATHLMLEDPVTGLSGQGTSITHSAVTELLPFSPCGRWVGTIMTEMRYRGRVYNRPVAHISLFDVVRLSDGSPILKHVMAVEGFYEVPEDIWHFNQQDGWSMHVARCVIIADYRRGDTKWRAFSSTNRWLEGIFAPSVEIHGLDFNGAEYSVLSPDQQYGDGFLIRRASDGVCSKIPMHSKLTRYLTAQGRRSLWSQDGTSFLRAAPSARNTTAFELVRLQVSRPIDSAWTTLKRVFSATARDVRVAVQGMDTLSDFLRKNGAFTSIAFPIVLVGALYGQYVVGMTVAMHGSSLAQVITAAGVYVGVVLGGILFSSMVSCVVKNYYEPRPWETIEAITTN